MNTQLTPDQKAKVAEAEQAIDRFIKAGVRPTVKTALCLSVIEDALKESRLHTLRGIPSGHLFAAVNGLLTLDEYQSVIDVLVAEGKAKRASNYLITWIAKGN